MVLSRFSVPDVVRAAPPASSAADNATTKTAVAVNLFIEAIVLRSWIAP
jgi:hypothetical protein